MPASDLVDILVLVAVVAALGVLVAFLVSVARSRRAGRAESEAPEGAPPEAEPTSAVDPVAETPTPSAVEAPVEAPAPEPSIPESPERLRDRLGRGLTRSREALGEKLKSALTRDRLDDEAWDEIEEALIRADLGLTTATGIVERLRGRNLGAQDVPPALRNELVGMLSGKERELRATSKPAVWLVVGVNGVGKTTTIAKLAHRIRSEGKEVVLAAADTFRAAAIDQLKTWAGRVGVHVVAHAPGADPGAVVYDALAYAKAKGVDVVIADTAGRIHTKTNLMEELRKIRRVAEREAGVLETLLVLDATVGQNGLAQAATFRDATEVSGVLLTKLDGTARGGIVLAIEEELGIPVKAIGIGESLDDLQHFDPEAFVDALLGS